MSLCDKCLNTECNMQHSLTVNCSEYIESEKQDPWEMLNVQDTVIEKLQTEIQQLRNKLKVAVEALEKYADGINYAKVHPVFHGQIAKEALSQINAENKQEVDK